jgi:hypothetical protein
MDTKYILFTGAGFTHNFGAPLARNMWCWIFNHPKVQQEHEIKELMLREYDYESVYDTVINSDYNVQEKEAISIAVKDTYDRLDMIIRDWSFRTGAPYPVNIYKLQNLIDLFSKKNKKGFIFTVNQDLLLERHYYNGDRPVIPGIQPKQSWFSSIFREAVKGQSYVELPSKEDLERKKDVILDENRFFYIKMHGSQNWQSKTRPNQMVIGRGKKKQIEEEPLLGWYFELFKEALLKNDVQILFIGYGFGDEHINEIIAKAVLEYSLGIHIICPSDVESFHIEILKKKSGAGIWKGLSGYYPQTLSQMFPADQSETQEYKDLRRQFFGINIS